MRSTILPIVKTVLLFLSLSLGAFFPLDEARTEGLTYGNLKGIWQVSSVNIDTTLSRKANYNYNDPRLLGRLVTIDDHGIVTDFPEASVCLDPKARPLTSTIDNVIATTMGKSKKKNSKLNKFDLPFDTTRNLQMWWVGCGKGDIGPDTPFGPSNENWIAAVSQDQIAMRWYDDTILLLQRLTTGAKPDPSFSCSGPLNSTERQVCSSLSLSGLDKSISQAFSQTVKQLKSEGLSAKLSSVRSAQKKWVMERNKCGVDEQCLRKIMHHRLDELVTFEE
jgi:hypothetical protein